MRWCVVWSGLILGLWSAALAPAQDQAFVPGLDGVPVMEGVTIDSDTALIFDHPQGRIVEVQGFTQRAHAEVLAYYGALLPALGWQEVREGHYRRDAEQLRVMMRDLADGRLLRFRVTPDIR